jgi:hypothetical protein
LGFSFKVKEDPSFQPQEYGCISRIENEDPTPRLGEKTILRWVLFNIAAMPLNRYTGGNSIVIGNPSRCSRRG